MCFLINMTAVDWRKIVSALAGQAERKNRVNRVLCGTACQRSKYKEKHRQLTLKAIDINFTRDGLFENSYLKIRHLKIRHHHLHSSYSESDMS